MAKNTENNKNLEATLWATADQLRKNMDAAEYKHVVLGLIFLKYISDAFEELYEKLKAEQFGDAEDPDEYRAEHVFFVPPIARWSFITANSKRTEIEIATHDGKNRKVNIGGLIDAAMDAIERDNEVLKDVLPKDYGRPALDKTALGKLIDLISDVSLGDKESRSKDVLGRVYEYFLGQFALAEGKKGGQFYTPDSIVKLLVKMLEPYDGRVYDPCCGSGGMFVQSAKFISHHADHYRNGKKNGNGINGIIDPNTKIAIYGQESNRTTWRLCRMNLAIRGIDASNIKWNSEGSFLNDAHPELKADYIMANPPFNDSDWGADQLEKDARWNVIGEKLMPPAGNANYAWVQHFLYHLAPTGAAGFVLSNGSLSSNTSGEGDIRQKLVEAGLVECIVMLPKQLFYNTGIPACLWFLRRGRSTTDTLFIDASELGYMENRRNKVFDDVADIDKVADTYHAWRKGEGYEDVKGYCKAATLEDIRKHKHVLTPGRYVGIPDEEDDGVSYEAKIEKLTSELREQLKEADRLDNEIKLELGKIGIVI